MRDENKKSDDIVNADEFSIAKEEAENSMNIYKHKFRKPYEYQGKTYQEMTFDWGKLTGKDGLAIENEMLQIGKAVVVPTFSGEYLIRLAARACTEAVGADAFEKMSIADYNKIRSAARSFLLKSEL
ncbi:MAG: phage tail assembly protein [Syntrophobacter sp.]